MASSQLFMCAALQMNQATLSCVALGLARTPDSTCTCLCDVSALCCNMSLLCMSTTTQGGGYYLPHPMTLQGCTCFPELCKFRLHGQPKQVGEAAPNTSCRLNTPLLLCMCPALQVG